MLLDAQTRRNLELFSGGRDGDRRNSLLGVLDLTRTALGARLLRRWLGQPLLDVDAIRERQDGVAWFHESAVRRGAAGEVLAKMPDFERLLSRISSGVALPREVVALRRGLELVPALREVLGEGKGSDAVAAMLAGLDPCDETSPPSSPVRSKTSPPTTRRTAASSAPASRRSSTSCAPSPATSAATWPSWRRRRGRAAASRR